MTHRTRAGKVFAAAMALLCISGMATYAAFFYFRSGEGWVAHTQEVRAALGDLEARISLAGRARMSYLLSGAASDLDDYRKFTVPILPRLQRLCGLVQDNPAQIENCAQLEAVNKVRLQAWEGAIMQKQQGLTVDPALVVQQNLRINAQEANAADAIRAQEDHLLAIRQQAARLRFRIVLGTVVCTLLIALILLYIDYRMLVGELRARESAERVARNAYERESALRQDLAASEEALRQLSLHLLRSQEEERKRIGRDLHDSLGQYLAMLKMNLDLAGTEPDADAVRGQIAQCVRLAEDSLREVRTISYLLYPPMLEEVGLKSAIPWYLEGFSKRSKIETTLHIDPGFERLDRDMELALFRVLQESLTNVNRHSGSTTASVRLFLKNGHAVLEVQDRGKGVPDRVLEDASEGWQNSVGVGVRGMTERMRQLGGKLDVNSSPNGTTVTASVPAQGPKTAVPA